MTKWEFIVGGGELVEDMRKAGDELSFHQAVVDVSLNTLSIYYFECFVFDS